MSCNTTDGGVLQSMWIASETPGVPASLSDGIILNFMFELSVPEGMSVVAFQVSEPE